MMIAKWMCAAGVCLMVGPIGQAAATTLRDDVGYTQLKNETGVAFPTGAGVPVTIVESGGVTSAAYIGKAITYPDGSTTYTSHANVVGAYFFGGTGFSNSIGTGITDIQAYNQQYWQSTYFIYGAGGNAYGQPQVSTNASRVANHSYQFTSSDSFMGDRLRRLDWVTATDDYLQVVGVTGSGAVSPLGAAYNTIAIAPANAGGPRLGTIGPIAYNASIPSPPTDSLYGAGRFKPDLVGPGEASNAAGMISGMTAMLIQTAHTNPTLSLNRSYPSPRTGTTIYDGETSEVIKAALMAGALRNFTNANAFDGSVVSDYRQGSVTTNTSGTNTAPAATVNGLDRRYGAGQANVYNSYHILTAGEADSTQDKGATSIIGNNGFDYDPHFGGAAASNNTATYDFNPDTPGKLAASLVWNIKIDGGAQAAFNGQATLFNLDLSLIDTTAGGSSVVATSASTIDNTENLWIDLLAHHTYQLVVTTPDNAFDWDYGLAWQYTPVPEPASLVLLLGIGGSFVLRQPRRRQDNHHG